MSKELILPSLEIQNFRIFRKLVIERLGRVNLIVGKNNVGKTSVLEALQLFAKPSPSTLLELISRRDEFDPSQDPGPATVPIETIFHGRLADADQARRISIGPARHSGRTVQFELTDGDHQVDQAGETPIDGPPKGLRRLTRRIDDLPTRSLAVDDLPRLAQQQHVITPETEGLDIALHSCEFIGSNGLDARRAADLWSSIGSMQGEAALANSLRIFEPRISGITTINDSAGRLVPLVHLAGTSAPIPLRSMGEGMVRLFHLALALVEVPIGILLVDEIENGLHYSIHEDLWKSVFTVAEGLNIQVFATTHSWNCIEAFQRAACEDASSDGYLIRLGWKRDEVVATVYDESDLAIVTRDHIEVR